MRVALVIGHTHNSPGACAPNECEYTYNEELVYMLANRLTCKYTIIYRDTYKNLPHKINNLDPDIILSFHCNAFNTEVSGSETLYYHTSKIGKVIATKIQKVIVDTLDLPDRGIKPKTTEDRGGYLLRYTNAPCVILEPFFIDNPNDLKVGNNKKVDLVEGLAKWINEYI